jgi:LacI family transcriptional regulator
VQLDRAVRGLPADAVMVDNGAASARAVEHLLGLGHRRIGLVSDSPQISSSAERISGYRRALRRAGVGLDSGLESIGGPTQADGRRSAHALLSRPDRPTAVFTANNFMTVGALLAMRDLGLRAPQDVALVGFDDLDWTTLVEPAVTVVAQPVTELGRAAGERLLTRMHGDAGPPRRLRLPTSLVVRASCGAAA